MTGSAVQKCRRPIASYDDVEVDLTLLVFRGLLPTMILSIVFVPALTTIVAVCYYDRFLAVQTVITLLVCTLRMMVVLRFSRLSAAQLSLAKGRRCQAIYGGITFFYCCVMSVTMFHTFRAHSYEGGWLCAIGVFCVCVGLSSRPGLRPWIVQASAGTLLGTLAASLALSGQPMRWPEFTILIVFLGQFCYAVQMQFQISVEQLRLRRKFRALSEQDTLTGLANRRFFEASLATLCASGQLFAILFIDLDRFKQINDSFGHAAGDTLLMEVADRLRAIIRPTDLLARLGGDEFAILQVPLLSAASATALATRINGSIAQTFLIDGRKMSVGASIGIRLSDTPAADAEALLGKADQALYRVKQAGGGSFILASA